MKRTFILTVVMAMVLVCSMQAHAALFNRGTDINGNRLIYDSDLNITWYDYTNNVALWQQQVNWASALSVSGGDLVVVYDDWRLPSSGTAPYSTGPSGYNITSSEMGHLYYTELGNIAPFDSRDISGNPQTGYGLTNTGDFQHLQSYIYWTGTEWNPLFVWYFDSRGGYEYIANKEHHLMHAIAVRDGDVDDLPLPDNNPGNNTQIQLNVQCQKISENVLPENSFISDVTTDGLSGTINYTANGTAGTFVMEGLVFPMIVQINKAAGNLITLEGKSVKNLVASSSNCSGFNPSLQMYEYGVQWTVSAATANTAGGGGNGGGGTAQLQFEGFIQAINNPNITIAKEGTSITLAVTAQTKITINGQIATLGSLQAGDKAQGKYDGGTKKIIQLTVER